MTEPAKFLSSRFLSASTLVGASVRNPQDESLGQLKDCMIDAASGKIAYGVLSFGGVLGVGNKLFAIPWETFRVDAETERLVLDVPKERLKDAPGFDADHWPNFAEPSYANRVHEHYATRPSHDGGHIVHPD
ncbi:MAG: PRC-barrel domain-containing protein [Rhodanobacteraceae bacterium]